MLELQETDGSPLLPFDFGAVTPGTTSPAKLFKVTNTGTTAIPAPLAWITQASLLDGEMQVTLGNVAVTGTSRSTATVLPALAPGASLSGSASWIVPADSEGVPVDTASLSIAAF